MKTTGDRYDRIQNLANRLEEGLHDLEREQFAREADFQRLYADSAELLGLSRKGPAYIRERARRLNDLLDREHQRVGFDDRRFQLLYRQLDKIRDPLLSDYFSPSLARRLERTLSGKRPSPADSVSPPLIYRLGRLWYLLERPIYKIVTGLTPDEARRREFRPGPLEYFPPAGHALFQGRESDRDPLRLMIVRRSEADAFLGLWFSETTAISQGDAERLRHNQEPLARPHRWLTGRVLFGGRQVYLIRRD